MYYTTDNKTNFLPRLDKYLLILMFFLLCLPLLTGKCCAASLGAAQKSGESQTYFAEGLKRIVVGDWLGAAISFEKSWIADPTDIRVLRHVAMAYNFSARLYKSRAAEFREKAFFYTYKLLKMDTQTADAHYLLGTLFASADRQKAIYHLNKFVVSGVNKSGSLVGDAEDKIGSSYGMLGYLYGAESDYTKCLESLKQFVARCDNDSIYAKRVIRAKGVIVKLEEFAKYKKQYDLSNPAITNAKPAQEPGGDAGRKKSHADSEPTQRKVVSPKASMYSKSEQRITPNQSAAKQEYEKAKESLDKELKERMREIEILTG